MKINEIFYSIQGEGSWSGLPNIFIRTAGCNLRCTFCDTKYAYYETTNVSRNEILHNLKKYPCRHVCLTGGEPLLQNETFDLIKDLIRHKYHVCVETNGSQSIENLTTLKPRKKLLISLDIKCPSSEMQNKMNLKNLKDLAIHDQLKFIIINRKDYNYAKRIIHNFNPKCNIFIQPVWGTNLKKISEWLLKDGLNIKLSLQLHKFIFGANTRA